jgi:hypothetical protein
MAEIQGYLQCLINKYRKLTNRSTGATRQYNGDFLSDLVDFQRYIQGNTQEENEPQPKHMELVFAGKMADLPEFLKKKMREE